mgnify:FL=1
MNKIKIVADSTCDLSPELVKRYDVEIVPLFVALDDKIYRDGKEITPDEVYAWADEHKTVPKTSAISQEDVRAVFKKYINEGYDIFYTGISSEMSASHNIAAMAAAEIAPERIAVLDSRNLSTGVGHSVIRACELAQGGMGVTEIKQELEKNFVDKVRASFLVDSTTYLRRGGRCSAIAAIGAAALGIKPCIVVENGAMRPDVKFQGSIGRALLKYAKKMTPELLKARPDRVFITHSGIDDEVLAKVREYVESLGYFKEVLVTRAGCVVSSHCGYGTLGILYVEQ